ncbi:MAG: DMT family transporter [Eubacteriaceae bacterium]
MKEKTRGALYVVIAMILFSTGGPFIKLIDANSYTITFGRALFAGILFLPFIQWKRIKITKEYLILAITYCYLCIMFVLTTKITTAANAIILQCTAPLWLYIFYVIKGRKVTKNELIPRLFILLGIVSILSDSSGGNTLGDLLALSNGIAYAMIQYFLEKEYPFSEKTVIGLNNWVLCLVILIIMPGNINFTELSLYGWFGLAFLGVFQIGLSYLALYKGIKLITALEVSMISLLEPILNPILVFFFVGEIPSSFALIGFGLILLGIGFSLIPNKSVAQ